MELPFHDESKADEEAKKSDLIAKSNITFIGHDETDMGVLEAEVRKIETDGLLWGHTNLDSSIRPNHLEIYCFVEDNKVWDFLIKKINALLEKVEFPNVEIVGSQRIKVRTSN